MRILIIDQCSKSKSHPSESPVYTANDIDEHGREALLSRDETAAVKARALYGGRQQSKIDAAVDALRAAGQEVDRYYISAGFGLVEESTLLPPYEVTFNEMTKEGIHKRSNRLGITDDLISAINVSPAYDLAFFPLGTKYYEALELDRLRSAIPTETTAVLFNQEDAASGVENAIAVSARQDEADALGSMVMFVKGDLMQNFASHIANGESVSSPADIRNYCHEQVTTQTGFNAFE